MAPPLPFASLLRSSIASSSSSTSSTSASRVLPSTRSMGRARPIPIAPYDPLRPLPDEHPPAFEGVHPLAKWDSFLDIPSNPSNPLHSPIANDFPIIPQRFPKDGSSTDDKQLAKQILSAQVGLSEQEISRMHKFVLGRKKVSNMTKGGRTAQFFTMCVVGSPERGLLGVGQGKNVLMPKAADQAFANALKNLDTVNRFENRTCWGDGKNMRVKRGAVEIQLRARPPGFGLRCSPTLHHIFTACGIKDISAKSYRSNNIMQVIKTVASLLQGGNKSPGLGNGFGGKGLSSDKGRGMRGIEETELERGRFGVEIGKKITRL